MTCSCEASSAQVLCRGSFDISDAVTPEEVDVNMSFPSQKILTKKLIRAREGRQTDEDSRVTVFQGIIMIAGMTVLRRAIMTRGLSVLR